MDMAEISVVEFKNDISGNNYVISMNEALDLCGASPLKMSFKTNEVKVLDVYPEYICFCYGDNWVTLSQIRKITKGVNYEGKYVYEILCGRLKPFEKRVIVTQI